MSEKKAFKILVVDDEPSIRNMLQDFLEAEYDVTIASNAQEALEKVREEQFDLAISDINMPGMKGYTLLEKIKIIAPGTKTVLITAYNIDNYIRLARNHGICNIIAKTTPFNFEELDSLVKGLTTGDIFGLERHLKEGGRLTGEYTVTNTSDAKNVRSSIIEKLPPLPQDLNEVKLVLDEILTNALYHSPHLESGERKYSEYQSIQLDEKEFIFVRTGLDNEKVCISILDKQGNLDQNRVLFLLDRHVNAEGIFDESGRGIFMSRIFSDRIVININPGVQTEVIIMFYLSKEPYKGYKPLYIYQL